MPRNKTAKRASRHSSSALANSLKIEKDFIGIPAKLASQLQKEISALKQKENKIKTALNKIKAQMKTWEARIKTSSKSKTGAAKKQLAAAKKAHGKINKTQATMAAELHTVSQAASDISTKHAKLVALSKVLGQFEKDWTKSTKIAKAKSKSKSKTKTKKKLSRRNDMSSHHAKDEHSHAPQRDSMMEEDVSFDETVEITS